MVGRLRFLLKLQSQQLQGVFFEVRVSHLEKKRGKTSQISEVCVSSTGVRLCCPFFLTPEKKASSHDFSVVNFSSQIEKVHMFDSNILVALLLMEKNPANQVRLVV